MKRREFSLLAGAATVAAQALWPAVARADAVRPEAGTDYLVLDPRAAVEAPPGKIEVVEFFWYSCPHCNTFEPELEAWLKKLPKDVAFRRVPVAFRDDFVPQQRLYYALEAMGLVDKLHAKVFAAIHVERLDLSKGPAILDWVAKQGVDRAKFTEQFSSFSVATKASRGAQLQNAYKVEGVPALGVAGRFYTDGSLAKSMGNALKVAESLVAGVRSGK
jgi:thiol:disulfide interchange protein DsbA